MGLAASRPASAAFSALEAAVLRRELLAASFKKPRASAVEMPSLFLVLRAAFRVVWR